MVDAALLKEFDYASIELRLVACQGAGKDVHVETAADVFGIAPEMVNDAQRRQGKMINFLAIYGTGRPRL